MYVLSDQFLSHPLCFLEVLLVEFTTQSRVDLHHYWRVVLNTEQANESGWQLEQSTVYCLTNESKSISCHLYRFY